MSGPIADRVRTPESSAAGYQPRARSAHVPELDIERLCKLSEIEPLNEAIKQPRAAMPPR